MALILFLLPARLTGSQTEQRSGNLTFPKGAINAKCLNFVIICLVSINIKINFIVMTTDVVTQNELRIWCNNRYEMRFAAI